MTKKDTIYRKERPDVNPFEFNRETAEVFDDMACRSIPGYQDTQHSIAALSAAFYQQGTRIYDVGCSTGTSILEISKKVGLSEPVVALDTSEDMLAIARERCKGIPVEWYNLPVEKTDFLNASIIISSYILQFVKPTETRKKILSRMYQGLVPGGALFLCEKLESGYAPIEEAFVNEYENFKRNNGYSETEIAQKKKALEGVLIPATMEFYLQSLTEAGFRHTEIFYKHLNFCCFLAVR